jgi:murein DD-endopeptidase MepM/ murein hydrolase activator NlpD
MSESAEVTGRLGEWELHFNPEGEWQYALQGIHALAEPDLYPLQLTIRPETRPEIRFQQAVPVRDGAYGYDPPLVVDAGSNDPETLRAEQELVLGLVTPSTPARMWEGLLSPPSTGHIVSFFGWRRSYNGGPYDSFHTGTDYFGGAGTPILAPGPGVVVFAGLLVARGNYTLIDHGWGVYSGYLHQSEILVAAGGVVTAGETIGRVGDTGRVTGPHLHWELWVNGVPVDAVEWTEAVFP